MPLTSAHPRAGGENEAGDEKGATFEGSSPRGRGKPMSDRRVGQAARLIPARAGKTHLRLRAGRHTPAHPRAGGENEKPSLLPRMRVGSSPRGRGKLGGMPRLPPRFRLIPARAGKTALFAYDFDTDAAHPRAGGENHGGQACT